MPKMRSTDQRRRLAAFGLSAAVFASLTVGAAASAGATPTTAPNHHGCAAVDPRLAKPGPGSADVIVVGRASAARQVRTAVVRAGGRITAAEPIVSGYRATIPRRNLRAVACSAGVQGLSPNSVVHFAGLSGGQASSGPGSQFLRATQALQLGKRGLNGNGVGVAVIDTGISPMSDVAGRVVYGPDLSGEGTYIDTYGHGTVMGALIGGDGSDSAAATG
jgi:serine protease AprX